MGHQILIKAQQLCILKEGTWKIGKQQKQKGLTLLSNSIQRIQKSWGTEMIGQKPASIKLMERVKCGGKTKTVIARLWLWKERLELEINKNCITHESIHFAPNHKFCWLTGQLTAAKWGFSPLTAKRFAKWVFVMKKMQELKFMHQKLFSDSFERQWS